MNNIFFENIKSKIDLGETVSPILFLWENLEILHQQVQSFIFQLFDDYHIEKTSLYTLSDNNQKIKINELREFILKSNMKSSFAFQVFFIENITRSTSESFHASLKFLEEPWIWNIVFLTAKSESGIPETVLSRLQIHHFFSLQNTQKNDFFYQLIDDFYHKKNMNMFKYFFWDKKIEKQDYLNFLHTFLQYIKENFVFLELLDSVSESIQLIEKNNVLPKYEVDKLLIKI